MIGPHLLLPRPREASEGGAAWRVRESLDLAAADLGVVVQRAVERLAAKLAGSGVGLERQVRTGPGSRPKSLGTSASAAAAGATGIVLEIDPEASVHPQGYRLSIDRNGARIAAPQPIGIAYGVATLGQWMLLARGEGSDGDGWAVPALEVRDRPSFEHRGVLLDISRNKVPKLETLRGLIDRFADWKINQLQLYMEHTFAYRGHETVWRGADPLTADDVTQLAAYCAERGIDLVPNQNSFGHFHRWLIHPRYRPLAECPEGVEHPFSDDVEPFSLCAEDPAVLDLLADLYDQLLPCFGGDRFNVGLDETFDLGRCRSAEACRREGKSRVYLRFLRRVHRLAAERGRRIQFWGDIVLEHPELISELPADGTALAWGYEADHPFAENARRFSDAGVDFHVCPGTNSWSSFAGRTRATLVSLANAARHGFANGAGGLLMTDWGDHGHLQPLPVSYPGLVAAAGLSWNVADCDRVADGDDAVADWLDLHVFEDRAAAAGRAVLDLGNVYRLPGAVPRNGSALFFLLHFVERGLGQPRLEGLSEAGLAAASEAIGSAAEALGRARMGATGSDLVARELAWSAAVLEFAARFGAAWLACGPESSPVEIPAPLRRALAGEMRGLAAERRQIWQARHRTGALDASIERFLRPARILEAAE